MKTTLCIIPLLFVVGCNNATVSDNGAAMDPVRDPGNAPPEVNQQPDMLWTDASTNSGGGGDSDATGVWVPIPRPGGFGYAWIGDGTASVYSPLAAYSYNSSGGSILSTRTGTGSYRVVFDGIAISAGGNFQVVSYGATPTRCSISTWGPGTAPSSIQAEVLCTNTSGVATDSQFVISYVRWLTQGGFGQISSTGSVVMGTTNPESTTTTTASRTATGVYSVQFSDTVTQATMQVTAIGGTGYCNLGGWGLSGATVAATVRCFTAAGTPADNAFSILYARTQMTGGEHWGFGFADTPSAASYTYMSQYSGVGHMWYTQPTYSVTGTRSSVGVYTTSFSPLANFSGTSSSIAMVTGGWQTPDGNNTWCKIVKWAASGPFGALPTVHVRCFSPSGTLRDGPFTVAYSAQ